MTEHQLRRGKPGAPNGQQRSIDLMKRDGHRFEANPKGGFGMWVPKNAIPDWNLGHPVWPVKIP